MASSQGNYPESAEQDAQRTRAGQHMVATPTEGEESVRPYWGRDGHDVRRIAVRVKPDRRQRVMNPSSMMALIRSTWSRSRSCGPNACARDSNFGLLTAAILQAKPRRMRQRESRVVGQCFRPRKRREGRADIVGGTVMHVPRLEEQRTELLNASCMVSSPSATHAPIAWLCPRNYSCALRARNLLWGASHLARGESALQTYKPLAHVDSRLPSSVSNLVEQRSLRGTIQRSINLVNERRRN
jgi:hypothetical protein